jgi:hypothetical protein
VASSATCCGRRWRAGSWCNGPPVGFFGSPNESTSFQVQVFGAGGTAAFAQFLYADVQGTRAGGGSSATIGYQAGGAQHDVLHAFEVAGAVADGTVLSLVPVLHPSVGDSYCSVNPNSTGSSARILATGSKVAAFDALTLRATQLPPSAFGFFLTSAAAGFVANPGGSQGNLCLSGAIGRYVGPGQVLNSGPTGTFTLPIHLGATPTPSGPRRSPRWGDSPLPGLAP